MSRDQTKSQTKGDIRGEPNQKLMTDFFKFQFAKGNSLSFLRNDFRCSTKFFLLAKICLFFALTSCVTKTEKYGYMFDMADHQLLEAGISNKERVMKIMGSPTIVSDFGAEEVWIYYSEKSESVLFFQPTIVAREIITIAFDGDNVAKKIERFDLTHEQKNLQFSSNQTPVPEHETGGFFKSLFSNVGQVKPQ